jgi:Ankyrin repeats (many copies)
VACSQMRCTRTRTCSAADRRLPACLQALAWVEIWDFCSLSTVKAAAKRCSRSAVSFAARAAAACSSTTRQTPLHAAAAEGDAQLAQLLLQLGAQINARNKPGATPLFCACESGSVEVARTLLEAGAEMWGLTASGENCMYIAALRGHDAVRSQTLSPSMGS